MKRVAVLALLLLAPVAWAQSVKLPAKASGKVSAWIIVPIETLDGTDVRWYLPDARKANGERAHEAHEADPAQGLAEVPLDSLFGNEWATKAHGRVFTSDVAGVFRVAAYCAKGDKSSLISVCTVTVGEPPPPGPGPGPGPVPPGPDPDPFTNSRAAPGLKCLIVVETSDLGKLPPSQVTVLTAAAVRQYLNAKCVKEGAQPAWRVWDRDVVTANESPLWQKAFAKVPRDKVPYILIGNGTHGYSGPLPATVAETMTLLQKFGG